MIDRDKFFDKVRADPFGGNLTQRQVDGLNTLLDVWEIHFRDSDIRWLAYSLATAFHETAQTMEPIPEYGEGTGQPYGEPVGAYGQCYYGRGYVQLTWEENYKKGEQILADKYSVECPMHQYPHRMLEHEPAALDSLRRQRGGMVHRRRLAAIFQRNDRGCLQRASGHQRN